MALIHCPECQKEISSHAKACPSCGCPITVPHPFAAAPKGNAKHYGCGTLIVGVFMLWALASCWKVANAAPLPSVSDVSTEADGPATFQKVFDATGMSKEAIYGAGRQWIAENFRSSKAVIEYEDVAEGVIIGQANMPYPCASAMECLGKPDWTVRFTMRMEAREGRFRLTFTNVRLHWPAKVNAGVAQPEFEGAVRRERDLEKIRPKLEAFGAGIQSKLANRAASNEW